MRTKLVAAICFCYIIVFSMVPSVHAQGKQLVYDYAGVFSDAELEKLENKAQEMSAERSLDIIIVFWNEGYSEGELRNVADDFYDNGGFGYEAPHGTGILMAVDVKSRKYYFSTSAGAESYFTNSRLDDLEDAVVPELSDNDWYEASADFIHFMRRFHNPNLPVTMTERVTTSVSRLPIYIVIAVAGSGVIVFAMVKSRANGITVNGNTYLRPGSFAVLQQDDIFVREHTTRTRIRRDPPSGSRGGGGGGHHISSGGFSHGGRSGSF